MEQDDIDLFIKHLKQEFDKRSNQRTIEDYFDRGEVAARIVSARLKNSVNMLKQKRIIDEQKPKEEIKDEEGVEKTEEVEIIKKKKTKKGRRKKKINNMFLYN